MSKKIIVASDNHLNMKVIKDILNAQQDADNYFHLGDSEVQAKELKPFISVMGNNDFDMSLPMDRIIKLYNHDFYLTHGHMYSCDLDIMSNSAKKFGCDTVLFGHLHEFIDINYNDIRFINPGSCRYNRYFKPPTYAILHIDNSGQIEVEKIELENTEY